MYFVIFNLALAWEWCFGVIGLVGSFHYSNSLILLILPWLSACFARGVVARLDSLRLAFTFLPTIYVGDMNEALLLLLSRHSYGSSHDSVKLARRTPWLWSWQCPDLGGDYL
ncbi:hypothetical protein F4861DRAFT_512324, partial [Xylaria intraflava]